MEIPDPVPEMVISIPKSGKIRLTSLEMADTWIAAICTAKDGMIAAQHAMGQCGTDDEDEPKLASDGRPGLPCDCGSRLPWPTQAQNEICPDCGAIWEHDGIDIGAGARINRAGTILTVPGGVPYPDEYAPDVVSDILTLAGHAVPLAVIEGWTWQQRRDAAHWAGAEHLHASDNDMDRLPVPPHVAAAVPAPAAGPPMCDAMAHDGSAAECARLDGHEPPHRTLAGHEWDDGPAPYHATSGPQCGARTPDDGHSIVYACNAQRGHGGPDHIEYGTEENSVVFRWPEPDGATSIVAHAIATGAPGLAEASQP